MKDKNELSPAAQRRQREMLKRFHEELKKQPEISDEDFMAEFEASDEEYTIGIVLPGISDDEKE